MKAKRKTDLWIYGRNVLKPLTQISMSELGKSPSIIIDSNVSGRYSTYYKTLSELPADIITIFAEIENSINNNKRLQHSRFEKIRNSDDLNKIKEMLFEYYKKSFTPDVINHYQRYINSIPKMKGKSKLERLNCLIEHHNLYDSKNEISFYLLLCIINISLNCDDGNYFKSIIHFPQKEYSTEDVRNFLFDFFIINNVNELTNDGYNVFLCTNDSGIAQFANYISKLTLIITAYNLHNQPNKKELYGIEKETYNKIMSDKDSHEIITKIRSVIYTKWKGNPKVGYILPHTLMAKAIQLALYGFEVNIYNPLYNWQRQ